MNEVRIILRYNGFFYENFLKYNGFKVSNI